VLAAQLAAAAAQVVLPGQGAAAAGVVGGQGVGAGTPAEAAEQAADGAGVQAQLGGDLGAGLAALPAQEDLLAQLVVHGAGHGGLRGQD